MTEPTPLEPTDPVLVRRFQQGQEQAFAVLMERHERRVYNLAYRMLGSPEDARDATQDAFLSCFRHLAKFRGDSSFSTWLHRIALNACYDALRRRRDTTSLEGRSVDPMPVPDHADRAAAATDVQRALLGVPPDFRAVLVMHELQDLPLEDIAATLGLPVGTVKSRLHRGRVALGRILSGGRADGTPNPGAPVQATKPMKTRPHLNS
ncbi:MAG: sigma-70 family RNA polymerase sigma factor [Actinobacteria bacterium]|nr:MAG: sigma-70 family RNA polymerase sigma factor [Actinomycetota bacterium]